jgi:hypothetical protein
MLTVDVHEEREQNLVRRIISVSEDGKSSCPDVFFECHGADLPKYGLLDFAVLATVFYAMRRGKALHINGPVSRAMLTNLEELQEAWAMWSPMYKVVPVTALSEVDDVAAKDRAGVFAYSGGVDSVFSLLRHVRDTARRRTCKPVAACLVQGFDIALYETDAIATAVESAHRVLDPLGIPLAVIKTNWTDHLCGEWTNEFGAALAACLHQFAGLANFGVMGADEDYAHIALPWGSNPASNPFLSGGSFEVITEGGGFTRTQRVKAISEYYEVARNLRVCWEGERTGRNCGVCEKCIRTKLNFMAVGKEPVCFSDGKPTYKQIFMISARGAVQRNYLKDIISTATTNGLKENWVFVLKLALCRIYVSAVCRKIMKVARLS